MRSAPLHFRFAIPPGCPMAPRICFIATDAISFNVLYEGQLEFLRDQGLELTLICGGSAAELARLRERKLGRLLELGLVRPPAPIRDVWCLLQLVLHLLLHRYDAVLSTTPKAILLGSVAAWLARQRNRIVFFQGRIYENFVGNKRRCFAFLDRLSIRLSTRVLFVSRSLRSVYEAEGLLPADQGEVVGGGSVGGVDTARFSPAACPPEDIVELRRSLAIPETHSVAVSVGRICMDKGLGELKDLAVQLAGLDLTFVVVGPVEAGSEDKASALFALANVRHVPFTREVAPYFLLADVHLFLSHREGFGNVALEAASCGLPTIGFDVVGLRDSIAHGVSGVRVPLGNTEEVAQLLADHLVRPGKFRAAFPQARAWATARFGREVQWNAFLDYFRSLVGGGRTNGVGASGSNRNGGI